ncbi:uncharacterized protein C2orf81 homolog [Clinocottus analis]|uniref:uncharacterized protein C2orf81 homolog n=1 Tax=Clinocottus analis TaxID=304258 RepID=UPI0035C22410
MPRSAAKSRTEKRNRKLSAHMTPPPTQELEVDDITPGRLTQGQWTDMLMEHADETDDTVGEIMEELMGKVMEGCFKVHIEKQIAPFSASWAKNYLTQTLERQIMCPNEGGDPREVSKTEDSEPVPTTLDAWVQGCVPVVNIPTRPDPASQQEDDDGQVPVQTESKVNQQCDSIAQTKSSPKQSEKETSPSYECKEVLSPRPLPKNVGKKRKERVNLPPVPKPVPSKLLPPLSCLAGEKDVAVEGQNSLHSVYNNKTGSLYRHKTDQPIQKRDYSFLPRHCIFPQYEIVDNSYTKPNSKKPGGLSTLEPRHNKQTDWTVNSLKQASRLDTMGLAKGVSFFDSQAVEIDTLKCNPPTKSTKLRPIGRDVAVPMFSVDQVTTDSPPQVTPLFQSK